MVNQFKAHPWHGIDPGKNIPNEITVFVEIVPADTVKYEIDLISGYLSIDRPQKFSNVFPALYGFIPRTYCGKSIAEYASLKSGRKIEKGDDNALDVCVLCDRVITHGDILLNAIPIGGLRMIDKGESDDKIIAVLKGDEVYAGWPDLKLVPESIITRLKHYFLTYKSMPGERNLVEIIEAFGKDEAHEIIRRSLLDYQKEVAT